MKLKKLISKLSRLEDVEIVFHINVKNIPIISSIKLSSIIMNHDEVEIYGLNNFKLYIPVDEIIDIVEYPESLILYSLSFQVIFRW
ncbi:hypothetical protein [Clostridioides difficile]|uniref:Uncharacterized protein n=1 Tax=Clostridioides difficile TaxID=1496 RepID=A0A9P3YQN7_CLODI|nr:hypothetical protein [Clostridioides difficile]AWH78843.1 hypothetical protein DDG61_17140 [Clostridioides difficile]AWH82668.1 hypothetical protein DDG63_17170 [Clostridioides difficile]AXU47778.1 hypothetical protein CDIF29627_03354 [Clostridioides difficile]EGT2216438.1 hypothetical protein [Clostridioides difficile]EGT3891491.1 hypothetical protein [Clostridioides difficile]